MAGLIAAAAAQTVMKSPTPGEALSGIFGSVSLTAWICLLVRMTTEVVKLPAEETSKEGNMADMTSH